jgi:pimeloyl-ACP methyl ester carboxylesterase
MLHIAAMVVAGAAGMSDSRFIRVLGESGIMRKSFAVAASLVVGIVLSVSCQGQDNKPGPPIVTDPIYTKPQQRVDMDHGRRMNLYCLGSGSPTVILDAGMGDSSISWALVQPALAKRSRTCAYDRAGMGFSDAATRASTVDNIAEDLHALLRAAHIDPPYVLVGHSMSGMTVRVFADRYRDDVVGMVLVEGSHEDQSVRSWAIGEPGRKEKWDAYLKDAHSCVDEARKGMVKGTPAFAKCIGDDDPRFSKAINMAQQKYAVTPAWQAAAASERENIFYASAEQTRATRKDFGAMPIIVLTHAPYPKGKDETQEQRDQRTLLWEDMHNQVAAMSTHGINLIVPRSGHFVQYDRPEIVIDAVNQAVAIAKEQRRE